jgi:hypothetical protein
VRSLAEQLTGIRLAPFGLWYLEWKEERQMNVSRLAEPMVPERLTETIEQYTPRVPSAVYFGVALGAMAMLLWSLIGVYMQLTDYRAASPAERLRRGDFRP